MEPFIRIISSSLKQSRRQSPSFHKENKCLFRGPAAERLLASIMVPPPPPLLPLIYEAALLLGRLTSVAAAINFFSSSSTLQEKYSNWRCPSGRIGAIRNPEEKNASLSLWTVQPSPQGEGVRSDSHSGA